MNNKKVTIIYIMCQAIFWCTYCISWSYTALFLNSRGYNSSIVGLVTGVGAIISVVMQPLIASVTKQISFLSSKKNAIILKTFSGIIAVLLMFNFPGFFTIAVLFTFLTAIDASIPSMLSTMAMDYINDGNYLNYGAARGCGSISYALFSLILGYVISGFGTDSLIILYIIFCIITVICMMLFPDSKNVVENETEKTNNSVISKYPFLMLFLISSVLLYIGHNIFNVFLINIIENAGGDSTNLGTALAISACVELPTMLAFVWIANRIPVAKLLIISSVIFTLKATITIFAVTMPLIYIVSFMQIGGFALFTPGSVYFINKNMDSKDSGVGQALLGSCSLGLGGTLGNIIGGFTIDIAGLRPTLVLAALLSVFGIIFMILSVKKIKSSNC